MSRFVSIYILSVKNGIKSGASSIDKDLCQFSQKYFRVEDLLRFVLKITEKERLKGWSSICVTFITK